MRSALAPLFLLAPLGAFVIGCSPVDADKAEPAYGACTPAPSPLAVTETAPNGQVPASLLASVPATLSVPFLYEGGATTGIALTFDPAGATARWVDMVEDAPGEGPSATIACLDVLEIDLPLTLTTEDGAFAFSGTLTFVAAEDGSLEATTRLPTASMSGSYDWSAHGDETTDTIEAELNVHLLADGTSEGEVSAFLTGSDGETAWAGMDAIGGW